jgi:hypothetical protein
MKNTKRHDELHAEIMRRAAELSPEELRRFYARVMKAYRHEQSRRVSWRYFRCVVVRHGTK